MPSREPEPRRRRRDHDPDASPKSPRDKDKDRLRPSRSSKSKLSSSSSLARERDRDRSPHRTASSSDSSVAPLPKKVTMIVPEMQRRRSDDRTASVYPSFSKAHSREAVNSRDSFTSKSPYTPDPTDLGQSRSDKGSATAKSRSASAQAPPSPPLTHVQPDLRRAVSGNNIRRTPADTTQDYMVNARKVPEGTSSRGLRPGSTLRHAEEGRSATPPKPATPLAKSASTSARSSPSKTAKASTSQGSLRARKVTAADSVITDSDATSIGPIRTRTRKPPRLESNRPSSPPSDTGSSPHTPKGLDGPYSPFPDRKSANPIEVFHSTGSQSDVDGRSELTAPGAPPPPPPPPAMNSADIPRVDYLLQHGGLSNPVPRVFASAARPPPTQTYQAYASPAATHPSKASDVQETFAPYAKLLENLNTVISKNGSVAVATGYKSVARRLLERLETVFARNISCESCPCAMCQSSASNGQYARSDEDNGVSWGEVLELVSGRQELPQWPPFTLPTSETGLGISHLEAEAPMQKLDIDVPEEYREHYIRQSKKTKQSVQNWLASQPEEQASPPQEVDDETLMFAMLTYLEPDQRRTFTALMRGLSVIPQSRAPTPAPTEPKSDFMTRIGTALQRLYRLQKTPRDPECAMYLLKNPSLHAALATLSAINASEWEVLVSGRFDGFLWSGAEDGGPPDAREPTRGPSRGPNATPASRNGTPFSAMGGVPLSRGPTPYRGNGTPFMQGPTRGPTPANAAPGPVAFDEETEIAVLAEVEREIYLGMEALEDAFEALHVKAESVRRALRERSTGLALQAQSRRGQSDVEVRMGTPAPAGGWTPGSFAEMLEGGNETDDGMGDVRSELAPDDSASNIGWREHGRRKERRKRREKESGRTRTPAVAEEDEENSDPGRRRRRH